uniref:Uncharacterized protein n=1 Tax=Micrurus paraensis TaxID=1970185 RepID=A0A2D4L0H1_9SAUR
MRSSRRVLVPVLKAFCLKRAKIYRGNSLREYGAIKEDCWRFDAVDIYADSESTTALVKASLASDKLDETDRSTAVENEVVANNCEGTTFKEAKKVHQYND